MQNGINLFRFLRKPYDYVAGRLPRPTFTLGIILKLLLRNKPKIAEQIYNCITGFDKKKGWKYIIALPLLKNIQKIADKII